MARLPEHVGFYIPNASDANTFPRMSEPDKIDFSTAANSRFGVIDGCEVTCSSTLATAQAGIVLIDGTLVAFPGGQVTLTQGGSSDRFDLVAVKKEGGTIALLRGTPAVDPVFPDVPIDHVVLAAIFAPTGSGDFSLNVIDKRKFVPKALLTKLAGSGELIRNVNGSGDYFRVLGDGSIAWMGDTFMWRSAPRTLQIQDHVDISGTLDVDGQVTGGTVYGKGGITGWNLYFTETQPVAATAPLGALWQKTNGKLYLNTSTGWAELATVNGTVPPGTVINSVEPPGVMEPKGWVALRGQSITEDVYPVLFTLAGLQAFITVPQTGPRQMTLPNASGRFMRGSFDAPGVEGGSDTVKLAVNNLPPHKHGVSMLNAGGVTPTVTIQNAPGHKHTIDRNSGQHGHSAEDTGHQHSGGAWPAGSFVCLVWGGQNKIDALFNDRNHTYSVESVEWTEVGKANITIASSGSEHGHEMDNAGEHGHSASISPIPNHKHDVTESEIGGGQAFSVVPAYLTMYTYIRS